MPAPASPDLNELRAFCAAAELGTVGRAAVRLHVSQPALSKRLGALEPIRVKGKSAALNVYSVTRGSGATDRAAIAIALRVSMSASPLSQ